MPHWHRFHFPLPQVLAAAEDAAAAEEHRLLDEQDEGPALWFVAEDGCYVMSNADNPAGTVAVLAYAERFGPAVDVASLLGEDVQETLPLAQADSVADGSTLLADLRQAVADGHTHFTVTLTYDPAEDDTIDYGTEKLALPQRPAAPDPSVPPPVRSVLVAVLSELGVQAQPWYDHGGGYIRIPLGGDSELTLSGTTSEGAEVSIGHGRDRHGSWQAGAYDAERNEFGVIYDSAGQGLDFTADTGALLAAVGAFLATRK
jgi:hypothetical protein